MYLWMKLLGRRGRQRERVRIPMEIRNSTPDWRRVEQRQGDGGIPGGSLGVRTSGFLFFLAINSLFNLFIFPM